MNLHHGVECTVTSTPYIRLHGILYKHKQHYLCIYEFVVIIVSDYLELNSCEFLLKHSVTRIYNSMALLSV
jgi:hypothetical protein